MDPPCDGPARATAKPFSPTCVNGITDFDFGDPRPRIPRLWGLCSSCDMMSSEVVSQAHRTKILWAPSDFAHGRAREGRMGGFDVEDSKADIPGGYSRADCVRERPRDGSQIGASENDNRGVAPHGAARLVRAALGRHFDDLDAVFEFGYNFWQLVFSRLNRVNFHLLRQHIRIVWD
jgi:hypothetical protein